MSEATDRLRVQNLGMVSPDLLEPLEVEHLAASTSAEDASFIATQIITVNISE